MLFYTYSAPGMFPGRFAGSILSMRPAIGGTSIRATSAGGFLTDFYLSDSTAIPAHIRIVCPD